MAQILMHPLFPIDPSFRILGMFSTWEHFGKRDQKPTNANAAKSAQKRTLENKKQLIDSHQLRNI